MINIFEVNETNKMIEQENLDVRTITMGISLLDCIDSDLAVLNEKIYKKITTCAKDLVSTGEAISGEYGIPIVNKRISVTPIALIGGAACKTKEDFVTIAETLDKAAKVVGVNFIGGYTALVSKKMTQAELAEKIHVTDKAVSRWERGLGFPDIQTIEPLAQALGISVLELMRSERQEKAKEEAAPEIQYTQKEVAEMLQNAGDISRQQKKQDRNANVIAGFLVIGVAAAAWAAKIVNVGGGLILGGLGAAAFVSLWYFFQNLDDEESRKVYGAASILSIGILASLVNFVWGDQLAEFIPGGLERKEQIFWTLWYLFVLVMMMIGTIRCIRRQRQKKEKKCKTVLFTAIMATIMFVTLWQYQNTMQNR